MSNFSCVVLGNESLLIQCAERLLQGGDRINAVITRNPDIRAWAVHQNLRVEAPGEDLSGRLDGITFDWLFSIANLSVIPQPVLDRATHGAINFHDGPLPRHAGLNAPVWAILEGEKRHGVTWHMIEGGIDEGDIVKQHVFEMAPGETALTLNTRCYEAAMDSFSELLVDLHGAGPQRKAQDLSQTQLPSARLDRPVAAARIDFAQSAESIVALVLALDHSTYWNPLTCAKVDVGGRILLVSGAVAEPALGTGSPGQVLEATPAGLVVATASVPVRLTGLRDGIGQAVCPSTVTRPGELLPKLNADEAKTLTDALAHVVAGEQTWRRCLQTPLAIDLSTTSTATGSADKRQTALQAPAGLTGDRLLAAVAAGVARVSGKSAFDLAYQSAAAPHAPGYLSTWVPLRLEAPGELSFTAFVEHCTTALDTARRYPAFVLDLVARDPAINGLAVPRLAFHRAQASLKAAPSPCCWPKTVAFRYGTM